VAQQTEIAVRRLLSPRLAGGPDKAEALLPQFAPLLPLLKAV
jgi:hypothetical protein